MCETSIEVVGIDGVVCSVIGLEANLQSSSNGPAPFNHLLRNDGLVDGGEVKPA